MAKTGRPFFGWVVMWAAFVIAVFGWGVGFYGPPIYLKAVQDLRGWPVGLVSGAVTVHFLAGVLIVANMPRLHDRFGIPAVTLVGALCLAVGVSGWALAAAPWQLFPAALLSGMGWVTLGAAAINAIIAPWFVTKRPAALSTAYNGASIGGVIFSPLWVALIGWLGFLAASLAVGAVMVICIAFLAGLVLGRTPASLGQRADGEVVDRVEPTPTRASPPDQPAAVASLWRDAAFLTIAGGMALALFAQIGLIAHLYSLLVPALGGQGAGFAAGMATAAAILGRSLVGWFMSPRADRRVIAALTLGVQAMGCAALLLAGGLSVPLLLAGVFCIGLGIGIATSMPPLIVQAEFSRSDAPGAVALVVASAQTAYAFAPAAFGLMRDHDGAEPAALLYGTAMLIQGLAALVYLGGRGQFRVRRAPVRQG